jgi:hypothetical protein
VYDILKHYLAITPEPADAAIAKLVAWMAAEGMAVWVRRRAPCAIQQ